MKKLFSLALILCASVQGTWAQYVDYVDHVLEGTAYVETVETAYPTTGLSSSYNPLETDWYDLREDVTFTERLVIDGDVKIVLRKGFTLTAQCGIYVTPGSKLTIYEQWKQNDSSEGTLIAKGNDGNAGIGGNGGNNVNIFGGTVRAISRGDGAGIGGGSDRDISGDCTVLIAGGQVFAFGYDPTVSDQSAWGGAGIGGGAGGDQGNGTVIIYNGSVIALGGAYASGIGGGDSTYGGGKGGKVYIYGGQVQAVCGYKCDPSKNDGGCAIGSASGIDKREYAGSLFINDLMKVHYGNGDGNLYAIAPKANRVDYCRSNVVVRIEPCDHLNNLYYDNINGSTHRLIECSYCLLPNNSDVKHNFEKYGVCECGLFALADDGRYAETTSDFDGKLRKYVVLSDRTLYKDGAWNTLCLPFDLESFAGTPLEGATVMELGNSESCKTGFDKASGTLYLDFVDADKIEAGHAYIVKWNTPAADIVNPLFTNVTINNENPFDQRVISSDGSVTFAGTYNAVPIGPEGDNTILYLGADNTLYYPSGTMTIGAQRAYFHLNLESTSTTAIKAFKLNFGDEETGIREISKESRSQGAADSWFTLDGRRLNTSSAAKGLYIHNGQKVLIK